METGKKEGVKKLSAKEYRDLMSKLAQIRADVESFERKGKTGKNIFLLLLFFLLFALLPLLCIKGLAAGEVTAELKKRTYHTYVHRNYAYLSVEYGLIIYDVSNPVKPVGLGSYMIPGSAVSSFSDGDMAYLCGGPEGVFLIDVSDKKNLKLISRYNTKGAAMASVKVGNNLFVADGTMGVSVLDITDKANPKFKYSIEVEDYARSIIHTDGILYVSDGRKGIKSFDVRGNAPPEPLKSLNLGCEAREIFDAGRGILVACGSGGVKLISKEMTVGEVQTFSVKDFARGVYAVGEMLFVADGNNGVLIYDLKEECLKEKTCLISRVPTPGPAVRVVESNGFLFISNDYKGLVIVDISDKEKPLIVFPPT